MARNARTVTVTLPPEIAERLDAATAEQGCSRSALVRQALDTHLQKKDGGLRVTEPTRKFNVERDWPPIDVGPWPEGFRVSREEIYGEGP